MTVLLEPGAARAAEPADDLSLVRAMVDVELAWLRVQRTLGLVGAAVVDAAEAAAGDVPWDTSALAREGEAGGNPALPVVRALRSALAAHPAAAGALHRGLTSQDVLDSALMLLSARALDALEIDLDAAADALAGLADEHRATVQTARTLGQPALPTTFGLKAAGWLGAVDDARGELRVIRDRLPVQCGGAAGTLAAVDASAPGRALEAVGLLAAELGLADHGRPWHTDRGVVTRLGDALVRTTDAIGKIATDVVLLSRPEIGEVREPDAAGRGMSSTLPQKRNPVLSVLVRAVAIEAPHLAATLHTASSLAADERPQGAWHAEWNALTTLLRRTQVAASQTAEVLAGLHVDADAMRRNVDAAGPALVAERLVGALPGLSGGSGDGGAALLETVRGALRAGAGRDDVRDLLRNGLPATVPDSALDDLLEPAAYVGAADALVDRALARYASRGMAR